MLGERWRATYWPWVQVLRGAVRACNAPALLRAAGRIVAHLGARSGLSRTPASGWTPDLPLGTPEQARRALRRVQTVLATLASERPLLVILDDLHAADESSLLLLQYLARELQQCAALILATHRDWEMHRAPAMRRLLGGLARTSQHLPLRGLAEPDVARFIEAGSGGAIQPRSLVSAVHRTTGGNPFFLQEVVRLLETRGHFEASPVVYEQLGVPLRVRETVRRRLESLSERCSAMLPAAAVVGHEFDRVVLGQVCGMAAEPLLSLLDDAVPALRASACTGAPLQLLARHLREASVMASPRASARLRARRRGPRVAQPERSDAHLVELAHHFGEAAGAARIGQGRHLRAAGSPARAPAARVRGGVAQFQRALLAFDLDPHGELSLRGELLLSLGDAQRRAGESDAARETFAHAAALARRLRSADMLARAALGFGGIGRGRISVDHDWIALLEEALVALGDRDSTLRARVQACLAMALYWSDSPERRDGLSRDAVAMARRLGDTATLAFALDFRLKAVWGPGGVEERLATADEILSLALPNGDRHLELEARRWKVVSLLERGDVVAADREIAAVTRIAEEMRDPLYRWQSLVWRAMRAALDGAFARAEALAGAALAAGERVQSHISTPVYLGQLFGLRWLQGRLGELTDALRALVDEGVAAPAYRVGLAQAAAQRGDVTLARRELDFLAAGGFAVLPHDSARLSILVALAEVVAAVEASEHAETLYEEMLPYARLNVVLGPALGCFGAASRYLGVLAAAAGRLDDAERHFTDALELNGRMGARAWLACVQAALAATPLRRGASRDAERAAAPRHPATQNAESPGMPLLRETGCARSPRWPRPRGRCRRPRCRAAWCTRATSGRSLRRHDQPRARRQGMRYLRVLLARADRTSTSSRSSRTSRELARGAAGADERRRPGASGDASQRRRRLGLVLDAQAGRPTAGAWQTSRRKREEADAANGPRRRDRARRRAQFLERGWHRSANRRPSASSRITLPSARA